MIAMMNELTDTCNWEYKIFETDFVSKWKSAQLGNGGDVTKSMVEWVNLPRGKIRLFHSLLTCSSVLKK